MEPGSDSMQKWMILTILGWAGVCATSVHAGSRSACLDAVVTVPPILELSVKSAENEEIVNSSDSINGFRSETSLSLVKEFNIELIQLSDTGMSQAQPIEVELEILSNLGIPFYLSQSNQGFLSDSKGNVIPIENFSVQIEGRETPLSSAPQMLTMSDSAGKSLKTKVRYHLNVPADQEPGIYRTQMTYSVTTQ